MQLYTPEPAIRFRVPLWGRSEAHGRCNWCAAGDR